MNHVIDNATRSNAGVSTRVAWLVLLAVATLQLAIAQHASAHALDDLGGTCALCVKLDDGGNALGAAAPCVAPAMSSFVPGPRTSQRPVGRSPLARDSRAPPSL